MPTLANNANVTLTLTDYDSVTISTLGVATVSAVSGLGVDAGKIGEFSGSRTLGPFTAGSLSIAASVRPCHYEVADGVRPSAATGGGAVATITGSYVVGQTLTATFPAGVTGTIQFTRTLAAAPFTKTAISGAVASAVNSLTYQVQSADAGYSIGVDCTTVQAGTGGVVAASSGSTIVQQAMKLRSNENYSGGNSGVATAWYKVEFDGPFDAAQWVVSSKVASGTPGTYKVALAVTDQILVDTPTNAFVPMRNGVAYNDNSANGWQNATFGGAATKTIGLAPVAENNSAVSIMTDLMQLPSLPRVDGKPGGILLVKVVQLTVGAGYSTDGSSDEGWNNTRGTGQFREWFCRRGPGVDGIAALTVPSGVTSATSGYSIMGYPVVTSNTSTTPTELVMFTGDSRKSAAFSGFNAPNRAAAMSLSTGARPISVMNVAGSGHGQGQYLQLATDALNAGVRPTVIALPGFSQNDFQGFAGFKTANDNFMAAARALPGMSKVKFILDTDYYVTGYAGATETARQQCITYAKSLHNGIDVFCCDTDAIITDYTTPSAPKFKTAYYTGSSFIGGDGVHAGQAGLTAMAYGDGTLPGLQATYKTVFGIA